MEKKFLIYVSTLIFALNFFMNTANTVSAACSHNRYTDYYQKTVYSKYSSSKHYKLHQYKRICKICNKTLKSSVNGRKIMENHSFSGSKCSKCGYTKKNSDISINIKVQQNNGDGNIKVGGTYSGAEKITIDVRNLLTDTVIRNQTCYVGNGSWYYIKPVEADVNYRFAVRASKGKQDKWAEVTVTAAKNAALQQALARADYFRNYRFTPKYDISDGKRTFNKQQLYQGIPYSMERTLTPSYNLNYQNGRPSSYEGFDCSQFISYVLGYGGSGYITQTFNEIAYSPKDKRLSVINNSGDVKPGDILAYGPAGQAGHVVMITKVYQNGQTWVEYINQQGSIGTDIETGMKGCTIKRKDTLSNFWHDYITTKQTYKDQTKNGNHLRVNEFYPD